MSKIRQALLIVMPLTGILAFGSAATAAPVAQHSTTADVAAASQTKSYSMVKEYYSKPLKRCIRATVWGTVGFDMKVTGGKVALRQYENIKLGRPALRVTVLAKCGKTKKGTALSKVSAAQYWYQTACKFNPNIGVSYPWGVSAQPTRECGTETVGGRSSSYGKGNVHTQYNSGTSVRWAKGPQYAATRGAKPTPLCLATRVSITGYAKKKSGYTSDSFIRNMKACVTG
jgi:hypothetical protein